VVRNYMAGTYNSETSTNSVLSSSTLQSSALVFTGPEFSSTSGETVKPLDYVSYVYKDLANTDAKMTSAHKHFGTRMRIIGHDAADPSLAASTGATSIFANAKLSGSSGGMGIMVDPETNNGYFLELIALTDENMAAYKSDNKNDNDLAESIFNVVLYKTCKQKDVNANNVLVNTITNIKVNNKTSKRLTYYVKNSSITVGDTVTVTGTGWNTSGKVIARGTDYVVLKYNGAKSLSSYSNGDVVSGDKTGTLSISGKAVPLKLWSGMAQILTDNGQFVGQQRLTGQDNPTVYDIALEYEDAKDSKGDTVGLKFFIYINNNLVGTTIDLEPIKTRKNTVALFVRGSSRVMFEHVYALGADESTNYRNSSYAPFKDNLNLNLETNTDSAFGKYSMPKAIQTTYFKGLSPIAPPAYGMFYDEFGTIMREAKYYDITFDKAYPVFRSMIAPSYNPIKGYAVSGYVSTPYGAEFMVFNTMDSTLVFGDNQNPLNIIGLVFTDQTDKNYSMDDHLSKMSDFSKYDMLEDNSYSSVAFNPSLSKKIFQNVKNSRNTYGRSAFSIDATYIQTQDDAERIMEWMLAKLSTPKKSIGVKVFGVPYIQLGDIVKIHHKDNGENFVDPENLFVVYSMDYSTNDRGPETTLYLSEVSTSA
jgi:hypothetical protein